MLTIRALSGASNYAAEYLAVGPGDYYSEKERVVGQWMGHGAEQLGLRGEVRLEDFDAIRQGLHPATGKYLRPRHSADRFDEAGERTGTARTLYDFTISAPKSVSVQALADPRLLEAHDAAVKEAVGEIERVAAARIRQHGADASRVTGNLVIAVYRHDTSRELDPQIHSHVTAGNLTYDGAEGRWKALQASQIYEQRAYLTEVYRNVLAARVAELGYSLTDRYSEQGQERGFEIAGIKTPTLERFSQRSAQRDKAIAEFTLANNRPPTDGEVAILIRETRADKSVATSAAEVTQRQWARMTPEESTGLRELSAAARQRGSVRQEADPAEALQYAGEHLFERVSIAKDYQLLTEALRQGRGAVELEGLKTAALRAESNGTLLRAGGDLATEAGLARERAMVAAVDRGRGRYERLGGPADFVISDRLRPEQKQAVETVLNSRDLAVNLRGAAGTGKTATLQEIHRGIAEGGRETVAVAPTRSAVQELEKVGFSSATTVEQLLQDRQQQAELRGKVLIVDEAGMISSRQMAELVKMAEHSSAQILFSGDTRQLKSVEAGDALLVLERESRLKSVSLSQVQRQTLAEYRNAVEELRQNPERGFVKFEQMGAVQEVEWRLRPQTVSQAYREAMRQPNAKGQTPAVLVVAPTHEDIWRLTHAIRQDLSRAGELGESQRLTRHVPQNWTKAEKQNPKRFTEQPGLFLDFHKATRDVKKGEAVEVLRVESGKVIARKESGHEITITRRQADAFSVQRREEIELAAGERLLLQANRRDKAFRATNGELVTVARVDGGRVHLEDGRTLPANYRQFAHGYAVTAHRSQGKTVDRVIVSGDQMERELFYVAATRARESLTVITSDKEQLRESIGVSGERGSASELARRVEQQQAHTVPAWLRRRAARDAVDERLESFDQAQRPPSVRPEFTYDRQQETKHNGYRI